MTSIRRLSIFCAALVTGLTMGCSDSHPLDPKATLLTEPLAGVTPVAVPRSAAAAANP